MKFINQRDYPHWLYITKTDMEEEERQAMEQRRQREAEKAAEAKRLEAERNKKNHSRDNLLTFKSKLKNVKENRSTYVYLSWNL